MTNFFRTTYNPETTFITGYYADDGHFPNIIIYEDSKLLTHAEGNTQPYIEVLESDRMLDKQMCVIDGVYQEYTKPEAELLSQAKLDKIAQIKINRDNWMYQPVEYSGNTYFATKIAGDNLTAAARSPRNIGIGSVQWMTAENSIVELEINEMEDIINLIEDQRRYSYFQEALLSAEINAIEIIENEDPEIAVTYEQAIEALNNIDITF